jgi:hypothetical protein
MPINVIVVASEDGDENIRYEDKERVEVLGGDKAEKIAVSMDDIFDTIKEVISKRIDHEAELQIELSGSVSLKADAGAKWLFLNVGGSATKTDNLKVTMKTKVVPAQ